MDTKQTEKERTPSPEDAVLSTSDEKPTVMTAENVSSVHDPAARNDVTKPYDPNLAPRYSKKDEDAVIRKLDWHLMPLIFVLYSLSVLDRSNLGNARISGMEDDIDLKGKRYDWLGTTFYISCKSLAPSSVSLAHRNAQFIFLAVVSKRPCTNPLTHLPFYQTFCRSGRK